MTTTESPCLAVIAHNILLPVYTPWPALIASHLLDIGRRLRAGATDIDGGRSDEQSCYRRYLHSVSSLPYRYKMAR
jgi:hypothetical protein